MGTELKHNWNVNGHFDQLFLLEQAIRNKTLAHGYIFTGPNKNSKKLIAKKLAQILLCTTFNACGNCQQCKTFVVGSNADYLELSQDDELKIESIRELGYKLALKPYAAPYKIAVIDNAHNMTIEAANSLLKVLEEPKPKTILILLTDNAHRLLPTISSRAQKINFAPLGEDRMPNSEWDVSLNLFVNASSGDKLLLASELAEKETSEIHAILEHWLAGLEIQLLRDPSQGLLQKIKSLMRAGRLLEQNVNSKLLLSELMLSSN